MATKDSTITNVVVSSDDNTTTKENDVVKVATTKNVVAVKENDVAGTKNVVADSKEEKEDETEAEINNVVAHDTRCTNEKEDKEDNDNEKETGIELNISLEKLNLGPKKKLLVLPIGGFLVHRAHRRRPKIIPRNRKPDFCSGSFMIYKRPFCEEFLKFCFERFEVGIWSSAMELDQSHCTETDFMYPDNEYKPVFLKELDHIWSKKYIYLPWSEGEYSASNTLLITDPVKALLNPPNTAIFLGDYDPKNNRDDFLGPNSRLRMFLDGLEEAKDVQTYVKAHPFGDPAITPSHADWDYYSKIIRLYGKNK
uniref:Mitochondrial import inner membrane translocase subunit TIM50 n=1 Tax=Helianthus annuus TaxID=4232 RepID=A0A251VT55_HELAN